MKIKRKTWKPAVILGMLLLWMFSITAFASDDNSLSSITVSNGTISPAFEYNIWEYDVLVAPGTTELQVEATTTVSSASITSIDGNDAECRRNRNGFDQHDVRERHSIHLYPPCVRR